MSNVSWGVGGVSEDRHSKEATRGVSGPHTRTREC